MPEDVLENDRVALHRRQLDENRQGRFEEFGIDAGLLKFGAIGYVRNDIHVSSFIASQKVHSGVVGDAEEPWFQVRRLPHLAERVIGLCQGVLDDVLAVEDRTGHASAIAMKLWAQLVNELHEAVSSFHHRRQQRERLVLHRQPSGSAP